MTTIKTGFNLTSPLMIFDMLNIPCRLFQPNMTIVIVQLY